MGLMAGLEGLDPEFASRLQALQAAARAAGTNIGWGSGSRTVEQQIELRRRNGCPDVWTSPASSCRVPTAIPGRSNHNHGLAMDITGDKAWANAHAAQFGLHFPVRGEDWHIEMTDGEGAEGVRRAQGRGAIGFDMNWQEETGSPEEELSNRLRAVMNIMVGGEPDATAAGLATGQAETMTEEVAPELGKDVTMIQGGQKSVRGGTPAPARQPGGSATGGAIKGMVRQMAEQMGWGADQWGALEQLVQKESSWNPNAQNPRSTAYGLFQFLDATWKNYGQKTSDPAAQAQAGLAYIRDRYGSPQAALNFHKRNNWY